MNWFYDRFFPSLRLPKAIHSIWKHFKTSSNTIQHFISILLNFVKKASQIIKNTLFFLAFCSTKSISPYITSLLMQGVWVKSCFYCQFFFRAASQASSTTQTIALLRSWSLQFETFSVLRRGKNLQNSAKQLRLMRSYFLYFAFFVKPDKQKLTWFSHVDCHAC